MVTARRVKLQTHWGRESELEPHFLLIGTRLGWLGLEHDFRVSLRWPDLARIAEETSRKLAEAGIREPAQLHFQFEADY
jgi:hypothetical protein